MMYVQVMTPNALHTYHDTEGLKLSTEVNQLKMLNTDDRDPELAHKSYEVCPTKCQKNHQLFEKYTLSTDHTKKTPHIYESKPS